MRITPPVLYWEESWVGGQGEGEGARTGIRNAPVSDLGKPHGDDSMRRVGVTQFPQMPCAVPVNEGMRLCPQDPAAAP